MQNRTILLIVIFILLINTVSNSQTKIDSLNTLLQTAEENKKGEILYELGNEYQLIGKFAKALEGYENAINILGDDKTKSNAMYMIGSISLHFKDYDKALEYMINGFNIREIMNDSVGIIAGYNNIANVYYSKEQLDEAINYYEKALQFAINNKNKESQAGILVNLAGVNLKIKKFDIAIKQTTNSYNISMELTNYTNMVVALITKGMTYYHLKKYNKSLEAYNLAYKICDENNLKYYSGLALRNIALTNLAMKNCILAEQNAKLSLEISEEFDIPAMRIELYRILSDIYKEKNDFEKSLEYFTIHFEYYDSISKTENIDKYNQLLTMHGIEQKENEILKLNTEQEKNKAMLKQQKILVFSISIILFISLFTLFIFVILRKKLIFSNENIVKRNLELVKSESQLIDSEKKLKESKTELEAIIEQLEQNEINTANIIKEKYKNISISENKIDILAEKIILLMETEKFYMQNNITKKKLADKLETNTKYISLTINKKFDCNVNTFINKYRIKEARRLLTTTNMKKMTIEAIAKNVGFNTINTFNKVFKNEFGITPSYYLKSIKNK